MQDDSFICVTTHLNYTTHSYVTYDWFICKMTHTDVRWLIHVCHDSSSWRDSFICDTWLIHMQDDSFIWVTTIQAFYRVKTRLIMVSCLLCKPLLTLLVWKSPCNAGLFWLRRVLQIQGALEKESRPFRECTWRHVTLSLWCAVLSLSYIYTCDSDSELSIAQSNWALRIWK